MKYYDLGKIVFSNNTAYIGQHLRVSEPNYIMICKAMDKVIKTPNLNFENAKSEFIFHLKEEIHEVTGRLSYTVFIFYDMFTKWDFLLYYDGCEVEPKSPPIELYINDIIHEDYLNGGLSDGK